MKSKISYRKGFTLLELLIVIGIIVILATITLIVLNPAEVQKEARDSVRQAELYLLNGAFSFAAVDNPDAFLGYYNVVYVSLPDDDPGCANLVPNLPNLLVGWTYACASKDSLRKVDGTGWIPIDFSNLSAFTFSVLPIDPINSAEGGLFYTYVVGSWEVTARAESDKYREGVASVDGGTSASTIEVGSNLSITPPIVESRTSLTPSVQ